MNTHMCKYSSIIILFYKYGVSIMQNSIRTFMKMFVLLFVFE